MVGFALALYICSGAVLLATFLAAVVAILTRGDDL